MMNQDNQFASSGSAYSQGAVTFDAGLRTHMIRVFNYVAAGLGISGVAAYAVFMIPALQAVFLNPITNMVIGIGLLLFLFMGMSPAKAMQQSVASLRAKYFVFTALLGTTLAYIFLLYGQESIVRVFLITAATFAGVSLFGYTTKRDLTGVASFLFMGLIGIIIASLVNLFLKSSGLMFVVSLISVLVFTGLIAFETQNAKRQYSPANSDETNQKLAIFSALGLYINFINLFQTLMRLMGGRQ